MKALSFLLVPSVALFVSACASGPVRGPGYGGPGYYGHDTVYVEGRDRPDYNRDRYDQTDVNVNRTTINDRTVNRTNVNQVDVRRQNASKNSPQVQKRKVARKSTDREQGDLQQPRS